MIILFALCAYFKRELALLRSLIRLNVFVFLVLFLMLISFTFEDSDYLKKEDCLRYFVVFVCFFQQNDQEKIIK